MKNHLVRHILFLTACSLMVAACQAGEESLRPAANAVPPAGITPQPTAHNPAITEAASNLIVPNKNCSVFDIPEKPLAKFGYGAATAAGWSNSGKILAVSSTVGTFLYDIDQNRQIAFFDSSARKVARIIFSLDDSLLFLGGEDGWITVYDLRNNSLYKEIDAARLVGAPDDKRGIKEMFFSPQGSYFAVTMISNNRKVLWAMPNLNKISFEEKVDESGSGADGFVFINDTAAALIGIGIQMVRLPEGTDLGTRRFREDPLEHWAVYSGPDNPDDPLLAWGKKVGFVYIYQVKLWRQIAHFNSNIDYPELMFSPTGKYIIAFKRGFPEIEVWDIATSTMVRTLSATVTSQTRFANIDPLSEIMFSSDGRYLTAIGATVYVWDIQSGVEVFSSPLIKYTDPEFVNQDVYYYYYSQDYPLFYNYTIARATQHIYSTTQPPKFAITKQNDKVALVTPLFTIQAYHLPTKIPILPDKLNWFTLFANLQFSDNPLQIPMRGSDVLTRVWDLRYQTMTAVTDQNFNLAKPDMIQWPGTTVKLPALNMEASLDDLGRIEVKRNGTVLYKIIDAPGNSIAFSPDGSYLVTAHKNGFLNIWRMSDGRRESPLREPSEPKYIIFSPAGDYLISVGYGDLYDPDISVRYIHIYKVGTWASVTGTILDEGIHGTPIGFWPDSQTMVLERGHKKNGTHGPTLIRLSDGRIIREWPVSEISFSTDGTFLEMLYPGKGVVEIWGCAQR